MKPLANCKTFVEGKGWIYNYELNKAPQSPKSVQEMVDGINSLLSLKNTVASLVGANKGTYKQNIDYAYDRELQLKHKYQ